MFIFEPPEFFAVFVAGVFLLIFVGGKKCTENPPGKSLAKSSKIYTTKIPGNFLQRGRAKIFSGFSSGKSQPYWRYGLFFRLIFIGL